MADKKEIIRQTNRTMVNVYIAVSESMLCSIEYENPNNFIIRLSKEDILKLRSQFHTITDSYADNYVDFSTIPLEIQQQIGLKVGETPELKILTDEMKAVKTEEEMNDKIKEFVIISCTAYIKAMSAYLQTNGGWFEGIINS